MENLSQHAVTRMQQRGIPRVALECLLEYGRLQYDHHGAAIVFLDKAARRRLARDLSQSRREAVFPAKAKAVFPAQAGIRRAPGFRITVRNDDLNFLPRASGTKHSLPRFSRGGSEGIASDKTRERGQWGQLEKHLNAYAVIATDGTITTVGHRYKRIPRP